MPSSGSLRYRQHAVNETDAVYVIRPAAQADADDIQRMITELANITGDGDRISSTTQDFLRYGFGPHRLFEAWVAERDDVHVGLCLFFFTFSTWLGEPGIYVQDLYVADAERGNGLGQQLLAAAAARGIERDASHMRLNVDTENAPARQFYAHIGMQHRHEEETFHVGGDAFTTLARQHR